jgi:hypothetical protein
VRPLFFDEADAALADTTGAPAAATVRLALTDPDSNEVVPAYAPRFAGDFMLTSQGDKEQVFVHEAGGPAHTLSVLRRSGPVDDTVWPSGRGAIYTTDNSDNTIYRITGSFAGGSTFVAETPCDADNAPSVCPGPGFPANFSGQLDATNGQISRVALRGPAPAPQGMLFLPAS